MNQTRIEQLRQFIQEDPTDPFNWYAMALEYQQTEPAEALALFQKIMSEHESYIPVYYPAGKLCLELNQDEKASSIFERGIEQAKKQGDNKALRELKAAREEMDW